MLKNLNTADPLPLAQPKWNKPAHSINSCSVRACLFSLSWNMSLSGSRKMRTQSDRFGMIGAHFPQSFGRSPSSRKCVTFWDPNRTARRTERRKMGVPRNARSGVIGLVFAEPAFKSPEGSGWWPVVVQISARQFRDGGEGGNFQRNSAAKLANEFCMHVVKRNFEGFGQMMGFGEVTARIPRRLLSICGRPGSKCSLSLFLHWCVKDEQNGPETFETFLVLFLLLFH